MNQKESSEQKDNEKSYNLAIEEQSIKRKKLDQYDINKWDDYCKRMVGLPLVEDKSDDSGSWKQMSA